MLLADWAVLPPLLLVLGDLVTPVLVARYALVAVPAFAIAVAVPASRTGSRRVVACPLAAVLAGAVTSAVQQSRQYKYENYRAAADAVDDTARPGDAVLFLPASARAGYTPYTDREPGEPRVTDIALRAGGAPDTADRIAGYELGPTTLAARLSGHPRVYLVGTLLDQAIRSDHSATDRARESVLRTGYTPLRTRSYGEVAVTLFTHHGPGAASGHP